MPNLTLDENHIYRLDGRIIPGVTSILKALNFLSYDGPWFNELSRKRGQILHKCIALMLEKDLNWDSVLPWMRTEVSSVQVWTEENGFKPLLIEKRLYSEIWGFAGTIDAFGTVADGSYALPDWKRGGAYKATKYQLALYVQLICENSEALFGVKIFPYQIRRIALEDLQSGRAKPNPYTDRDDREIALAAVKIFHRLVNDEIIKLEA